MDDVEIEDDGTAEEGADTPDLPEEEFQEEETQNPEE